MRKGDMAIVAVLMMPVIAIGFLIFGTKADSEGLVVDELPSQTLSNIASLGRVMSMEDGVMTARGSDFIDYLNPDGSHTMTIGIPNVWNGTEWRPVEELSKIAKIEYKNGKINISTPYWYETYEIVAGDSKTEVKLSSISTKQNLVVIDGKSNLEYGLNVSGIPMVSSTPLDYVAFKKIDGKGNPMGIEISYDSLENQGFSLDKSNKDFVKVTNPKSMISNGMLYLDPTLKLNANNVTDDTYITPSDSGATKEVGSSTNDILIQSGTNAYFLMTKIRIDSIPSDAIVTNATLYIGIASGGNLLDAGESFSTSAYHVYDANKYNITGMEWVEGNTVALAGTCTITNSNTATIPEISWRTGPNNITAPYGNSGMNFTALSTTVISTGNKGYVGWVVTDAVKKEKSLNNRNVSIFINATIASGTPNTGDCVLFNTTELGIGVPYMNVTYTLLVNPSLNSTNSTFAGSDVLHSLNWTVTPSNSLSGYIFSFCNGTWNGTDCTSSAQITRINIMIANATNNIFMYCNGEPCTDGSPHYHDRSPSGVIAVLTNSTQANINIASYNDSKIMQYGQAYSSSDVLFLFKMKAYNPNAYMESYLDVINITGIIKYVEEAYKVGLSIANISSDSWKFIGYYPCGNNQPDFFKSNLTQDLNTFSYIDSSGYIMFLLNTSISYGSGDTIKFDMFQSNITYRTIENLWVNSSWSSFGASTWSNVTKTINSTIGANVAWRVYANDSFNDWNASEIFSYVTDADSTPPKYSNVGVNNSSPSPLAQVLYYANWMDNVGLGHWIFSWNATGALCTGGFANDTEVAFGAGTWSNVTKQMPLACAGKTIDFIFYANDTSNNWNSTGNNYETESPLPQVSIASPTNTTYTANPIFFNASMNIVGSWCGYSLNGTANATMLNVSGQWRTNETLGSSAYNATFYCNDTGNNMNGTETIWFTVSLPADTCTYSGSGNWNIDCLDGCAISSAVNVDGSIMLDGAGSFYTGVDIGYTGNVEITGGCVATCQNGCFKKRA